MENNIQVSDQIQEAGSLLEAQTTEAPKVDTVAYETHKKLLGEKKRAAEEVESWKTKAEQLEQERLEEKGQLSELVDKLREQNRTLNTTVKTERERRAYDVVGRQIELIGTELNCRDNAALIKLGDFTNLEPSDDRTKANDQDVRMAVEAALKQFPYLVEKRVAGVSDMPPGSKTFSEAKTNYDEMSIEDIFAIAKELDARK